MRHKSAFAQTSLGFAASILIAGYSVQAAESSMPACEAGREFAVLVSQDTLYFNRPAREGSLGQSIVGSMLASALTGGIAYFMFRGDPGALVVASEPAASEVGSLAYAQLLARELERAFSEDGNSVAVPGAHVTSRAEDIDALVDSTPCTNLLVISAAYELTQGRDGIQIVAAAQAIEIPRQRIYERRTVWVMEHRSLPVRDYMAKSNNTSAADALETLLAEDLELVKLRLRESSEDIADMIAVRLGLAKRAAMVREPLGRSGIKLICGDCSRADVVVWSNAARAWIEPRKHPGLLRSMPVRG